MKKILLLLLLATFSIQAQTLQNPTYGNVKLKNNVTDNSATKVNVQSTDGTINTISKSDLVNVVEVNDVPSLPLTGVAGKIYVVKNINKIYRWNGTFYQELGDVSYWTKTGDIIQNNNIGHVNVLLSSGKNFTVLGQGGQNFKFQSNGNLTSTNGIYANYIVANTAINGSLTTNNMNASFTPDQNAESFISSGRVKYSSDLSSIYDTRTLVDKGYVDNKIGVDLTGKINISEKGAINGVATLGSDGKVPNSQIPALAISETFPISSQAQMLALSQADQGDVAIRSDISKSFILRQSPASILGNWSELLSPTDAVTSVAGKVGVVTLNTSDIGGLQTALDLKANDSEVVKLTGDQTIDDYKTFTSTITATTFNDDDFAVNAFSDAGSGVKAASNTAAALLAESVSGPAAIFKTTSGSSIVRFRHGFDEMAYIDINGGYVKPSAPSSNILLAGGGDLAQGTAFNKNFGTTAGTVAEGNDSRFTDARIPLPNSSNYIQNQNASAQAANMWISGAGQFGSSVTAGNITSNSSTSDALKLNNSNPSAFNGLLLTNDNSIRSVFGLGGSAVGGTQQNQGYAGTIDYVDFGLITGNVRRFTLNGTTGAATFSSTVTASPATVDTELATLGQVKGITDGKVDKVTGKSLISDSEITRLATVTNQDISGKFDKTGGTISGNVNVTGTVTASPATASNHLVTKAQLDASVTSRPYKVYTALLTQSGTNAPTAVVLENTLGGSIVWSYVSIGQYRGTLTGAFLSNKTVVFLTNVYQKYFVNGGREVDNSVMIGTQAPNGGSTNGDLSNTSIEIRVYL